MNAFLSRGFRPFFLGTSVFAVVAMTLWLGIYGHGALASLPALPPLLWHGHEMVFGYALAVVAGFLLTAAQNWTGVATLHGKALAGLFLLWLLARIFLLTGSKGLGIAATADLLFTAGLFAGVAHPVIKVRQRRQTPVLLILALLVVAQGAFYYGALGARPDWALGSLYAGFYLVLGLILFIGRRVIPFFTERGVGYPVQLANHRWNDVASFVLYPLFVLAEAAVPGSVTGAVLAGVLFLLNGVRLVGWHTPGIWKKPLLWSLYLAWAAITLGFLARALAPAGIVPPMIALHAFAVGGVGLVTISMMTRVSLGHTGRNVHRAPRVAAAYLALLVAAALLRTLAPALDPAHYKSWVMFAGLLWIIAFALFAAAIGPMLTRPRADNG